MAQTPTTLLIPFKGGLNTFSNPQLLNAGHLTAATGIMLDRPGAAYAGPGFTPIQFGPSASARVNHGIATVAGGPTTNSDQLLLWDTIAGGTGPGVHVPGNSTTEAARFPLAPWRQATQRFQAISTASTVSSVVAVMSSAPQCAVVNGRVFYVWTTGTTGNQQLTMCYQDIATKLWAGPFVLVGASNAWGTNPTGGLAYGLNQIAVAGDSQYLRVAARAVGTGASVTRIYSWLSTNLFASAIVSTSPNTSTGLDVVQTGDEYGYGGTCPGAFIVATGAGATVATAYWFSGASSAVTQGAYGLPGGPVFTASPLRVAGGPSTGFIYAGAGAATSITVLVTDTTVLGNTLSNPTFTGLTPVDTLVQMTITPLVLGSYATFGIAVELKPAAVTIATHATTYNYVYFATVATASLGAVTGAVTQQGWGGLALLGRFTPWATGAETRPLLLCRSGWRHYDGAFGTVTTGGAPQAYPNGYLYDYTGQLYGKFGDSDVGTDALWPEFASASYAASTLSALASGIQYTLATGQRTLTYPWPQYGDIQMFSAQTRTDGGSAIGAVAGLATVTWNAPTASEPPGPSVQFGASVVIPGTLTAIYDGSSVFEAGFLHAAPTPFVTVSGTAGSLPTGTTYTFYVVAAYEDSSGRIHYSAPSKPVLGTTTGANQAFDIAIPRIAHTLRTSAAPITFFLYRNCPSGLVPAAQFRLPVTSPINLPSLPGSLVVTVVTDGTSDVLLATQLPIYMAGFDTAAAIGNAAPPPFDSVTVWNNQIWGLANRNGPELWCTWPQDFGVLRQEGPAWSPANRIGLPAEIGTPKGLVGLDEKLLVFGTRADVGLVGNAPARASSLLDNPALFQSAVTLPSPGGARVLNSQTRLPGGVLLQGTQGFVILDRSLSYQLVGAPVKDFTKNNLYLPGVFLPEQQAVLLFSASAGGTNLVYFYDSGEWSAIEPPPADLVNSGPATAMCGAARAIAGQVSSVYVLPNTGSFYDTVASYSKYMSFRTPWISLESTAIGARANVATSAFLREIHVLGTLPSGFPGTQNLTLVTEYDYAGNTLTPSETQTLALTTGSQADLDYQWRFGAQNGNCRRVRFTLTVDGGVRTAAGNTLPTVLLTGLMLSYSVDAGLSRVGGANSTGT
jgi:hypothetical protein